MGAAKIRLVMADTALVPDDGITAGSRTTPSTVPAVRQGAATARELLTHLAAERWKVDGSALDVKDGTITHKATKQNRQLCRSGQVAGDCRGVPARRIPSDVAVTPVSEWEVIGTSVVRPNIRDLVTGAHRYPSDIARPGMLYGKVLRPPSYGATLESIDLSRAKAMKDVVVVRDGEFVGLAAPSTFRAEQALDAVAKTATWKTVSHPSSNELFSHLKKHAGAGRPRTRGSVEEALAGATKSPRARPTKWRTFSTRRWNHGRRRPSGKDGKLTVWTGVDGPQRVQGDLARALGIPTDRVRVIVPDMGGGFGGKHTGEAAEEAARLAKAAGRPVAVHWTRAEEFTWAYFRPAAVIECQGWAGRRGLAGRLGFHQHQRRRFSHRYALRDPQHRESCPWAPILLCVRVRIGASPRRPTISPASRSWTNWRPPRRPTRSRSDWPISRTPESVPCWRSPPNTSTGLRGGKRSRPKWASAWPAVRRRTRWWRRVLKWRSIASEARSR